MSGERHNRAAWDCVKFMCGPLGTIVGQCALARNHDGPCKTADGETEKDWVDRLHARDPIAESLERQDAFYRENPRSIPGEGFAQPYGIEEQYRVEAERKRKRDSGVPE